MQWVEGDWAAAQTSALVDSLGVITANQVKNGLGFGLDADQDWQWAAVAAAGATHARIQCSWEQVEQQTAAPLNKPGTPQYVLTPQCAAGLASAKAYGIHPTVTAAYGAPHHQLLTVTVPAGAPAGASTLDIVLAGAPAGVSFAQLAVPFNYFGLLPYGRASALGPWYGTYIAAISKVDATHATIQLASALTSALPADGTAYAINEVLYPSAASASPSDPSIVAYGNYVMFLAQSMAAAGVTGDIELWNEPPSATLDPWDNRYAAFDSALLPLTASAAFTSPQAPNFGFVANLQSRTMPPGITLTWNGTSGDGSSSILGAQMKLNSGVAALQPATVVTTESFHPYGGPYGNPEDVMWSPGCLLLSVTAQTNFINCLLSGERKGPNNIYEAWMDASAKALSPAWGVNRSITETNILPASAGFTLQQARFQMRQYLGFQALGYTPVEFYKLYDANTPSDPNFSFVQQIGTSSRFNPKPGYTALAGLMSDLTPFSAAPVSSTGAATLASVGSYGGTYPLTTVHMVGSRSGAVRNSEMFVLWQRSTTPCTGGSCTGNWLTLASPAPAAVAVQLPVDTRLTSAVNLTTRAAVAFTTSGQTVTLAVADDPVALTIDPAGSLEVEDSKAAYTGTAVPASVTTEPAGLLYAVTYNGSSTVPANAGTYTVVASPVDPSSAAPAVGSLVITPAVPALGWLPDTETIVAGQPLGQSVLDAGSNVAGTIAYTASGATLPATPIAPGSVLPQGDYVLSAVFTPADHVNYTQATATSNLSVLVGHVLVTDDAGGVGLLSSTGKSLSYTGLTGATTGVAVTSSGLAWTTSDGTTALSQTNPLGQIVSAVPAGSGGLNLPTGIAIDGWGQIWVANQGGSLSLFAADGTVLSPTTGLATAALQSCSGLALDSSGSIWVSDPNRGTVTRILGAAIPVAPLVTSTATKMIGVRP